MFNRIKLLYSAVFIVALCVPQAATFAEDLADLTWSDRISKETTGGDIVDTPPFVEIWNVRLSRFSQLQALNLQTIINVGSGEDKESLYVFRTGQGGASQGEQLMGLMC